MKSMALPALLCGVLHVAAAQQPATLLDCARIHADAERLACFDRVVAGMQEARPQPVTGNVVALRHEGDGALVLDNGQVWRQQDDRASLVIEVGDSVNIERASLGTFRITDKRGRSARFRRLR
jgi:hypothetical protein